MTKERPWHTDVSAGRILKARQILAAMMTIETGEPENLEEVEYRENRDRCFWIGDRRRAAFDMWGNLVIYNRDND